MWTCSFSCCRISLECFGCFLRCAAADAAFLPGRAGAKIRARGDTAVHVLPAPGPTLLCLLHLHHLRHTVRAKNHLQQKVSFQQNTLNLFRRIICFCEKKNRFIFQADRDCKSNRPDGVMYVSSWRTTPLAG